MRYLFTCLTVTMLISFNMLAAGTIMAVFAHPDDEISIAPALARYASEGHDVYLVIATSGQIGDANTDIPRGSQLGAAREAEARCSSDALGIHAPYLLQFMDGELPVRETIPKVREKLRQLVEELKPDILITWGPDGLSGHPDHRIVSTVTTEVFQQTGKLDHRPGKLYYVAMPESRLSNLPPPLSEQASQMGLVSDDWITTIIDGSGFLDKTHSSIQCHKTQWPQPMMERLRMFSSQIMGGKVFLRLAMENPPREIKKEDDLF